ncbi:uncharacterized protein B0H18DRAFT_518767 [Fomitopsis serialis]|uniref:uncharacterized protein n=1 Tax=Fomitopsis serialis TaxID=139415 RepID=UPI00200756F8|nr:uncharacterized protein B0H18DRAFT_518767 [Neoantrodia serialis]KAH9922409.1 hypothetical protein B0H18DRAFT_518767 [Neoantrodia serialis]
MATQPLTNISVTATATSSAPSGSSSADSGSSGSGDDGTTSSATLYLYTFLATLLLLLSVSAAIVVRSYLIRRRQRQLIADAIRDGLISGVPAPGVSFERAALLARKPELFDVYLGHAPAEREKGKGKERLHGWRESTSSAGSVGGGWWNAVMPVAAREAKTSSRKSRPVPTPPHSHSPPVRPSTFARFRQRLRTIMPMPSVGASVLPAPATSTGLRQPEAVELSPQSAPSSARNGRALDVAFLVAMPAPHHESHHVEQEDVPYVEFGIARVRAREEVVLDEGEPH